MARKFAEAEALLHDLLDRSEGGVGAPVGYPDLERFPDVKALDAFERRLAEAERAGAVSLVRGTGRRRGELKLVRLADAEALALLLGREGSVDVAGRTGRDMLDGFDLHPALDNAARTAIGAWSRGRSWHGVAVGDAPSMRLALALAQAIVEERHLGLDYRTFSKRVAGHSKSLEELEALVLRLVGTVVDLPTGAPPRATLEFLGLERFGSPLLIAGTFHVHGSAAGSGLAYVGILPEAASAIGFPRPPQYVLTIENFASFNRHVREADPEGRGLTIYVGGYPSRSTQAVLSIMGSVLSPDVPFLHWSDIDLAGTWIFRTVERSVGRPIRPHLMSRELAERYGVPGKTTGGRKLDADGSGISDLVDYLARSPHKTLEQEEIDPVLPL